MNNSSTATQPQCLINPPKTWIVKTIPTPNSTIRTTIYLESEEDRRFQKMIDLNRKLAGEIPVRCNCPNCYTGN